MKALITGINGQDGSYLAEHLLSLGYEVHGILKRNSVAENQTARLNHIFDKVTLDYADMTDMASLVRVLKEFMPDEVYNLAAQSHVRISFDQPIYTAQVVAIGTLNLLEAIRLTCPDAKIYQASSSEMFGNSLDDDGFQRETTPMHPASPYGCAKLFAYNLMRNYRHGYGMHTTNGILFNHESPRRGTNFVTNKVVKAAVKIRYGLQDKLMLGNLDATRDWGHAKDYVRAMHMIINHTEPDDFVCATGISHSVKDLVKYTFTAVDLPWEQYVGVDEKYWRPDELVHLKGDPTKAKKVLNLELEYTFETMIDEMISYWLEYYRGKANVR